jgi:hypothetical protein
MPLCLAVSGFCDNCWYIVLEGRRAMFRLVCLNRLVILRIAGLWYVKVTLSGQRQRITTCAIQSPYLHFV